MDDEQTYNVDDDGWEDIGLVTGDILAMFIEAQACKDCRDSAIRLVFSRKTAVWYGTRAVSLTGRAWEAVKQLYPETVGSTVRIMFSSGKLQAKVKP